MRGRMAAGLVAGEGFAVDSSVIEADASRFKRVEGSKIDWSNEQRTRRPAREYLAALDGGNGPTNPKREPKALSPTRPLSRMDIARASQGDVRLQPQLSDRNEAGGDCRC